MTRQQPFSGRPQDLPTKAELARLRVEYEKDERLAYLGHLEVIATVERCVRRAGLPFSIGNGFARRMRLQFSGALPVGASSACEYYDIRLTERVDAREALGLLRAATPPALAPTRAAYVPGADPALEAWLDRSSWEVELVASPVGAARIERAVESLRARGTLTDLRGAREKTVDRAAPPAARCDFALRRGRASAPRSGRAPSSTRRSPRPGAACPMPCASAGSRSATRKMGVLWSLSSFLRASRTRRYPEQGRIVPA